MTPTLIRRLRIVDTRPAHVQRAELAREIHRQRHVEHRSWVSIQQEHGRSLAELRQLAAAGAQ